MDDGKRARIMAMAAERKAAADAQQRQAPPMIFKTMEDATPPAPPPAPNDVDERIATAQQFILDVMGEVVAELKAENRALKDEVADLKRAFFNTPADLVASTKAVRASLADVQAALADVRTVLESARSVPLDLPALPRRDFN